MANAAIKIDSLHSVWYTSVEHVTVFFLYT